MEQFLNVPLPEVVSQCVSEIKRLQEDIRVERGRAQAAEHERERKKEEDAPRAVPIDAREQEIFGATASSNSVIFGEESENLNTTIGYENVGVDGRILGRQHGKAPLIPKFNGEEAQYFCWRVLLLTWILAVKTYLSETDIVSRIVLEAVTSMKLKLAYYLPACARR